MWEKREAQWEKERKARERLMHEVNLFQMTDTFEWNLNNLIAE